MWASTLPFTNLVPYEPANSTPQKYPPLVKQDVTQKAPHAMISVVAGAGEEMGINRIIIRIVKLFCAIRFSKPMQYTTRKMNLSITCRFWVPMMCQCRFIGCNMYCSNADVEMKEIVHVGVQRMYGELYTFFLILLWI